MARIVVSENVTLDGVVQDPTGEDGFRHGGWFTRIGDADMAAWATHEQAEAMAAGAMLLGRRAYEFFVPNWADRPGEWAGRLRELPKYVVSSTLENPTWVNTTVLTGDVPEVVGKLKQELDGDIVVYGSRRLVGTLLAEDLVDEVRLIVFPVVLGEGDRWFGELTDRKPLRRTASKPIGDNLIALSYRADRG